MATVARRLKFTLLITAMSLAALQSSERDAAAQDPPNRLVKFAINPRTNSVVFGDEFDFHEDLASQLPDYNANDGYVGGSFQLKDGKTDISFRPSDIKNDALRQRWSGSFAAEFLRQKAGQPEFAQFHGAAVFVGAVDLGFFDARPGRGVVPAPPPALPSAATGSSTSGSDGPNLPPRVSGGISWTDPVSGNAYSVPNGYSDFWAKLPDSVRREFAKADANLQAAWASDLRLAMAAREDAISQKLRELGRPPTPSERAAIEMEAAQAAHRAVLQRPRTTDRGKLVTLLDLEAAELGRKSRLAVIEDTRAKALPKVQVFGDRKGSKSTLEALKAEVLRQVEPLQRLNRELGTTILVEKQFLVVFDPSTGNWAFLPETGGPNAMTMDDAIVAIGSAKERVIFGHVTFRDEGGRPAEWAIDLSSFPPDFGKQNLSSLKALFAGLNNSDEADALAGFLLKIKGSKAFIEGDTRWWTFSADAEVIRATSPPPVTTATSDEPFFKAPPDLPPPAPPAPEPAPDPRRAMVQEPTPLPDPATPPSPPEVVQGPTDPEFEAKARALLDSLTSERLDADRRAKRFDVFKDELFRASTSEESASRLRTWKRVLAETRYAKVSDALSQLRFEMVVSFCERIAAQNQIRLELIDSGKTNGFRSDLDLTIYIPFESRGNVAVAGVIAVLKARINALLQTRPEAIDITLHNGDYWIPDPRNTTQSFEEHARTLHEVLGQLRENARNGVDVFTDPDANRKFVQRRGLKGRVVQLTPVAEPTGTVLIDGRRVPLATRLTVRRVERPATEWSWRAGVGWEINSERLGGLGPTVGPSAPAPDPSDRFGNVRQSLTALVEKGSDPEAGAKAFNRGMEALAPVNSYYEIHVSTLADTNVFGERDSVVPQDEEIRIAFDVEEIQSGRMPPAQRNATVDQLLGIAEADADRPNVAGIYQETAGRKKYFKLRWIARNLGLSRPETPEDYNEFRRIYRLMEISADMEHAKNTSSFTLKNPSRGRSTWFKEYFEDARKTVDARGEFAKTQVDMDAYLDAVYQEAYRLFAGDQKALLVDAMAREMVRVLRDLTPAGMARNAMQFALPDGRPDVAGARKLAQQRREQLVQLIELYESMGADSRIQANPIEAATIRRALLEKVIEQLPQALRSQVEELMNIEEASLDNFLDHLRPEDGQVHAELEAKRVRMKAFIEAKRQRLNAVGRTAQPVRINQLLKNHWLKALWNRVNPADSAALKHALDFADRMARTDPNFVPEVQANFTSGLVLANSLTNIARALQSGDDKMLREVMVSEFFNLYLPPRYGVVAMLLKDFGRGQWMAGGMAVATLGIQHSLFGLIPGLGEAYMLFELTRNNALIAYTYFSEQINNDLIDNALRSRPRVSGPSDNVLNLPPGDANTYRIAGKAFANSPTNRGPLAALTTITATTPPRFPLLFEYAECGDPAAAGLQWGRPVTLKTPYDRMPLEQLIPLARKNHGTAIWQFLLAAKLTPTDINAATFLGSQQISQSLADYERDRLLHMYAFDLPYYYRVRQIWECFYPTLKKRQGEAAANPIANPGATDEDSLLDQIFGEVVDKWLSQQQPGYADQYSSLINIGGGGGPESAFGAMSPLNASVQSRVRNILVATLVERYKWYERVGPATTTEIETMKREAKALAGELDAVESRALGMKTASSDELGQRLDQHVTGIVNQPRKETAPAAWLSAPPYYVPLQPSALAPVATRLTSSAAGPLGAAPASDRTDILVNVQADRSRHPEPWSAKYAVSITSCDANWQAALPGLRFNAAEQQLLNQKTTSGKPAYQVTAVSFNAGADVLDARGQKFVSAKTIALRGYVIDPVPQIQREVTVRIDTRVNGAAIRAVAANVRVGSQSKAAIASTSEPGVLLAAFSGFEPGSYDIQVTPDGSGFAAATSTATFTAPSPNPQACAIAAPQPQQLTINVGLPYTPPATTTTAPVTPPPSVTTPPPATPPPSTLSAEEACINSLNDAMDQKDRGNLAGAQRTLAQAQAKCANIPGAAGPIADVTTLINGSGPGANAATTTATTTPGTGPRAPGSQTPPRTPSTPPPTPPVVTTPTSPPPPTAEQLGNLEGTLQGLIEACNLTGALTFAEQSRAIFAQDPRLAEWLGRNLPALQRQASAQTQARTLLTTADRAIQQRNVAAALAAAEQALALPDLPPCMREQIEGVLGDLRRDTFRTLINTLIGQTDRCEADAAVATRNQLQAFQPRDEVMNTWLTQNKAADTDAFKRRVDRAKQLLLDATTAARTATTQADWDAIVGKLELANGTALGCAKTLGIDTALADARKRRPLTPTPPTPPPTPPTPPRPPVTPPPPPVTPPPLPPTASLKCTMVPSPDLGYQGDQVELTIEIDPRVAAQVTQVTTSNPGCPGCTTTKASAGRFTQSLFLTGQPEISLVSRKPAPLTGGGGSFTSALPGFEKRVSINFVASDAANRQVCTGSADVKFGGTRQ